MMTSRLLILSLALMTLLASNANAADNSKTPKKPKVWEGNASLGIVINTGNTDNKNFNTDIKLNYNPSEKWNNSLEITGQLQRANGDKTAQRYDIQGQTRYNFTRLNFVFGNAEWRQDKFSPYLWEANQAIGYGRRLMDWQNMTLDVQAGPGLRQNHQRGVQNPETRNEFILYSQGTYKWQITDATQLSEVLSNKAGHPDVITKSVTALTTKIIGNLGMQVSYTIEHNSFIPDDSPNTKKTDTLTNVAIVYNFL